MSTLVEDINDAISARVAAVLTDFTELNYFYEVEKNNFRENEKRYGVVPDVSDSTSGITKNYTQVQNFLIKLVQGYVNNRDDDSRQRDEVFVLYENMHTVFTDIINTRAGGSEEILLIDVPSIDSVEFLEEAAVLVGSVPVTFRVSLV